MSAPLGYLVKCTDCDRTIRRVDTRAEIDAGAKCAACRACAKCGKVFSKGDRWSRWDHGGGSIALCSPKCD